jgi:hypothetical protein
LLDVEIYFQILTELFWKKVRRYTSQHARVAFGGRRGRCVVKYSPRNLRGIVKRALKYLRLI